MTSSSSSSPSIETYVESYGDLIYDLCLSVLVDSINAQIAFRAILKKIHSGLNTHRYETYERSWVLKITCELLLKFCNEFGHHISPEEQIKLDSNESVKIRFQEFSSYFHRLMPEDQLLLLMKEKLGIPDSEISIAMSIPEASLKIRRQQALRALEDWIWSVK